MRLAHFSNTNPLYALAPLAGFTDLPFRSMVKKFGVDLTVSEMISSNALVHQSKKTYKMIEKSPLESFYSVQLAGSNEMVMQQAVEYVNTLDGVSCIDLNCGCPAPKVVNNLQGSSLLTDLTQMANTIRTIKKHSNKPYTSVKIRIGFNEKNPIEIAKVCEDNGADFIAVHGRTRAGRYKATVDYDAIRNIKKAVLIPVIANGDIDSTQKAKWVLEHTGADGVMIGRAAVGKPWIFHQIKENTQEIPSSLILRVVLEHYEQMLAHYGVYGAVMFRKHLHTYSKAGFQGASAFRDLVNKTEDIKEMREIIEQFFSQPYLYQRENH